MFRCRQRIPGKTGDGAQNYFRPALLAKSNDIALPAVLRYRRAETALIRIDHIIVQIVVSAASPEVWSALAGVLLQPSGFIKIAAADKDVERHDLLIKTTPVI